MPIRLRKRTATAPPPATQTPGPHQQDRQQRQRQRHQLPNQCALGQRVRKVESGNLVTDTVYGEEELASYALGHYQPGNSSSTEYIYLPTASGPMPVAVQIGSNLYAIDSDHLNTPRRLSDSNGRPVWQWVTTGFGELEPGTASTGFTRARLNTGTPAIANTAAVEFNLRYPGQQHDAETGLYYNHHRTYDPYLTIGYTQADPIGLDGGWNRFGYVGGNPLSFVDPEGLQSSVQWCYQSPANAVTCNEAGMLPKPIRIPPPIVFPDDCNSACEQAIIDASNAYWRLTTKRLPQYESGGTRGRDSGHANAIPQLQRRLKDAIRRVQLHCTTLPPMLPEWERAANEPLPR